MNRTLFLIILTILLFTSGCGPKVEREITLPELRSILEYIATDSLKGRYPGSPEDMVLASYLSSEMDKAGLMGHAEEGIQYFDITTGIETSSLNSIVFGQSDYSYSHVAEFQPLGFSSNGTFTAEVIVVGLSGNQEDPFNESVSGKWLMVMPDNATATESERETYIELRTLALKASDHQAVGIIFVSQAEEGVSYPELNDNQRLEVSIPAIMVSKKLADEILKPDMQGSYDTIRPGATLSSGVELTAVTQIDVTTSPSFNSVSYLEGSDDVLAEEYVIIGAHHDHLGMGGEGTSSRQPDTIAVHYGADDNASGVSGVMELAEYIATLSPLRSFSFLTFGGEEMGLLGSKFFVENPTIDLEKVQAMINLDMIGRLNDERQIQIGGIGTSPLFRSLIDTINVAYNFNLKYSEAGYGPSDHSSFYAKDIPVLFISTGAHADYHTPSDDIEKINYEGLQELLYFVSDIAVELANAPEKIEFTLAGPKTSSGSRGRRGGITFGLMPDMTYDGNEGMPVTFVTEGKPAAIGGMKGGDIIKAVDGKSVGNVYDYMERLGTLKEGQTVVVKIERDGESMELLLQL